MSTIPMTIVSAVASSRYATALLMERSIGPMWIGIQSCSSHSCEGSNSSSPVPVDSPASATCGSSESSRRQKQEQAFHAAGFPKYVTRESASSSE